MENPRIIYMGTPDFAVEPLKKLFTSGFNIVGVVTVPDKQSGRGHKIQFSAVKKFALDNSLPVYQPENLKDPDWIQEYQALKPDLGIVVAFRMLPKIVWSYPQLGTFNLHASLLPLYRGAAPINWAIINGDKESGNTTFFLDEKIDTGRIIMQEKTAILDSDTAGTLHDRLMYMGADMVVESVRRIIEGKVGEGIPQHEISDPLRCYAPKIFKDDCHIDWNMDALALHNRIRGLSPYPAAWFELGDTTAKILETTITERISTKPGDILSDHGHLYIAAKDKFLEINVLQAAGSRAMKAEEYLRGHSL